MADTTILGWEACAEVDADGVRCSGVQLTTGNRCLAHAAEDDVAVELKRLSDGGALDGRGVPITGQLLDRLLAAVPRNDNDQPVLNAARFNGATFQGKAGFHGASFQGGVLFIGATFRGGASFIGATFQGGARFDGATFRGEASFIGATFQGGARFDGATFRGEAGFQKATFGGEAWFYQATLGGEAWFYQATFQGRAVFGEASFQTGAGFGRASFRGGALFIGATFGGDAGFHEATFGGEAGFYQTTFARDAGFHGATFGGDAGFDKATFQGQAGFGGATFEQARQLGPMLVRKQLVLDLAVFKQRVQIEVGAAAVCCRRTQFPAGVHLRLRWASVVLDDADLGAPSILAGVPAFPAVDEAPFARAWARLPPPPPEQRARPRLLSVRRANLAGLTASNVDLRACRFLGAHNLDRLHIEGQPLLARARGRRRTGRLTLAEEHHWRHQAPRHRRGWSPPVCHPPAWANPERSDWPGPAQLAGLYRELRKGREDTKDEPGAADFYYGEMEMRRHSAPWWSAERVLLTLYWLVSGYALRAWRAFAALLLVVVAAAGVFATVGFGPPASPRFVPVGVSSTGTLVYEEQQVQRSSVWRQVPAALGYSAEVATSLLRGPDRAVTVVGEWTQAVLRWLGPLLFGLALVSLRGRVKR